MSNRIRTGVNDIFIQEKEFYRKSRYTGLRFRSGRVKRHLGLRGVEKRNHTQKSIKTRCLPPIFHLKRSKMPRTLFFKSTPFLPLLPFTRPSTIRALLRKIIRSNAQEQYEIEIRALASRRRRLWIYTFSTETKKKNKNKNPTDYKQHYSNFLPSNARMRVGCIMQPTCIFLSYDIGTSNAQILIIEIKNENNNRYDNTICARFEYFSFLFFFLPYYHNQNIYISYTCQRNYKRIRIFISY